MQYSVTALQRVGSIKEGDCLAQISLSALAGHGLKPQNGDVLVFAQKIISKAEGRQIALQNVIPSPRAESLAQKTAKDPRLVELILRESSDLVRVRQNLIIARHRLGFVLANAGIDQSNIGDTAECPQALLLPMDPDASAARLSAQIEGKTHAKVAVMIIDSLGRAWRRGTVGTAIGVSGLPALLDLRGRPDRDGRKLETSELGVADEIAAAASLAMGQADENTPIVLIRGLPLMGPHGVAQDLIRPLEEDLFP